MKKIVCLMASPNKDGNSVALLQGVVEGMQDAGEVDIEVVHVYDMPLASYSHAVKTPTEDEKAFSVLMDTIMSAQGLVIVTPTFNFGVPAVLKNFIDRMGYKALDYKTMNKLGQPTGQLGHLQCLFVASGGTPQWMQTLLFMLFPGFWLRAVFAYYGCTKSMSAYVGKLSFSNPAKGNESIRNRMKLLGQKFVQRLK